MQKKKMLMFKAGSRICVSQNEDVAGYSIVCLFVLRFYSPVNPMGSCRVQSVYLTTLLLGRHSPQSG